MVGRSSPRGVLHMTENQLTELKSLAEYAATNHKWI